MGDYNIYKDAVRKICKEYDELVLLPGLSPHLSILRVDSPNKNIKPYFSITFGDSNPKDCFIFLSQMSVFFQFTMLQLKSFRA